MIQLKVYETSDKLRSPQYFIELYETEPIKLTLSIEDITNADATSTYSKAFKVPGTRKNAEFFKNSFDVDGTLYDVTIKKPAEVLVDGTEFKQGHVRLQRVFFNTEQDRYDYELLFLGETRDFSSIIGDAGLCDLDLSALRGDDNNQVLNATGVIQSWQAYPENPSLTAGLHDGDIIYPLIDHGNTYDDDGLVEETKIAVNFPHGGGAHNPHFTLSAYPIGINRLKPMIRARRLVDEIFDAAGYTYTSEFFGSNLFNQVYISAFGNEATIDWRTDGSGPNSTNTAYGDDFSSIQGVTTQSFPLPSQGLSWPNNVVDPGNNFNFTFTAYTPPSTDNYVIKGECYYDGYIENSDYTPSEVRADLHLWNYTTNTSIANSGLSAGATLQFTYSGQLDAGNQYGLIVIPEYGVDWDIVTNVKFQVLEAPGIYDPSRGLECSYKQIDFIKDILTAFRLVLSPDPKDPKNFIVEPWQTYINSGQVYDWSDKLVENKDVVIEPVFFSQSEQIKFDMQPGGDYTNVYHKQAYSENFGYLEFNSGNELLKGTRDVKLIGIAPTPLVQIEGASYAAGDILPIPQLHTHSSEDDGLQHLPIKAKTRMLFYNGLQPFVHPNNQGAGANNTWYLVGASPESRANYPLVSPYQEWPIQPQTLNLNWYNDVQYWGTIPGYNQEGSTLYSDYWSRYIGSLYNKYSRRVTAYFVLNNIDLNEFSFDDTIFVNGTYYRPEKIIDVQVGAYTEVKVQLLTANDYKPRVFLDEELTNFSLSASGGGCGIAQPSITVTTDGTPPFTWTLQNGSTGVALQGAPVGQAPYQFDISPVVAGNTVVSVEDNFGRTNSDNVTVPQPTVSNPTATWTLTDPTSCTPPCNGTITVTPATGAAPYTILWMDGNTLFERADLCAQDYTFIVTDANGCTSPSYLVEVECDTPGFDVWYFAEDFACEQLSTKWLKVEIPVGTTPSPQDVYQLTSLITGLPLDGCFRPVYQTTGTPTYETSLLYVDCNACHGITPPTTEYVILEDCNSGLYWTAENTYSNQIGHVVQYREGVPGVGPTRCGTIVTINQEGTADSTIIDGITYACGDLIHCPPA